MMALSKISFFTAAIALILSLFAFQPAQAASLSDQISGQVNASAVTAEVNPNAGDPQMFFVRLVKAGLGLLGMFFMILTIMAGYWWATARGDESKVEKAQKTLRSAVIGLIIVLSSYSITTIIGNAALDATQEQSSFNAPPQGASFDDIF